MKLKDVIEKLEDNSEYQAWRKENPKYFLAHAFMMMDKENENIWQIGYYDAEKDVMTTFIIEGDSIKISPELNIFKKPDSKVEELDVSKVKIGTIEAIEKAEEVMAKEYPKAVPSKMFFIIQKLAEHGYVFNITFITLDFKTVNIRISSENGEVLHHNMDALFDFKK